MVHGGRSVLLDGRQGSQLGDTAISRLGGKHLDLVAHGVFGKLLILVIHIDGRRPVRNDVALTGLSHDHGRERLHEGVVVQGNNLCHGPASGRNTLLIDGHFHDIARGLEFDDAFPGLGSRIRVIFDRIDHLVLLSGTDVRHPDPGIGRYDQHALRLDGGENVQGTGVAAHFELGLIHQDLRLLHLDDARVHQFKSDSVIEGTRSLEGDDVADFNAEGFPAPFRILRGLAKIVQDTIDIDGARRILHVNIAIIRIPDSGHGSLDSENLAVGTVHHLLDGGDRSVNGTGTRLRHNKALLTAADIHEHVGRAGRRAGIGIRREDKGTGSGTARGRSDREPFRNRVFVHGPAGRRRETCGGDAAFIRESDAGELRLELGERGNDLFPRATGGQGRTGEDGKEVISEFHINSRLQVS